MGKTLTITFKDNRSPIVIPNAPRKTIEKTIRKQRSQNGHVIDQIRVEEDK